MTPTLRALFFAALISFGGVFSAEASPAVRCEEIFEPSVRELLTKTDQDHSGFLFQGKTLEEHTAQLSWYRRRKVRRLLDDMFMNSQPSEAAVIRYSAELDVALFGRREIVDAWLFKSKEQRLEDSAVGIVRETLLREGLVATWKKYHDPNDVTSLQKDLDTLATVLNKPIAQILQFPWAIPRLNDNKISPPLMYGIIRDGLDAHIDEVRGALSSQSRIEAANTFRRLYLGIFYGTLLTTHTLHNYQEIQARHQSEVQGYVQQIQELDQDIQKVPEFVAARRELAYKESAIRFFLKYNDLPNAAEEAKMRAEIASKSRLDYQQTQEQLP